MTLPRHIAIIMDGNGRWANARGLPRHAGHKQGVEPVRMPIRECMRRHIGALTLFAFSSENWKRPGEEVGALDRKSTRLNSSHVKISYAGFCSKKTKQLERSN